MNKIAPALTAFLVAIFAMSQILFTVDEREFAMISQFGEVKSIQDKPGLGWKLPFIQKVTKYSKQILTLDSAESDRFNTKENQPVQVDSYVKWQIADAREFLRAVAGDEKQAERRIGQTVTSLLREEFGRRTLLEVISGEREKIMSAVRESAELDAKKIGVKIVDVRLKRVDFDDSVSTRVFDRMRSERQRVAAELRSTGGADGEKIKADADKQAQVILAEAYKTAQEKQGAGDAKAAAIYSAAYGQNAEFYSFYRSLDAYKASFKNKSDVMVLDPSADFFKFLKQGSRAK
ncbi:MAG: protease modulator HflC [Betaproteobacteria bacterium]|nr:MAG: protease modulator HflC [Betaproteobacteria bacterium]TAG47307.1 MAG: protease modulator HflC [Betaproteobacteria bacterium]